MNGREAWERFAEENNIEWEVGPSGPRDSHGTEYDTYVWDGTDEHLLKFLHKIHAKYIVIRMFPQDEPDGGSRMRFSDYPKKPVQVRE